MTTTSDEQALGRWILANVTHGEYWVDLGCSPLPVPSTSWRRNPGDTRPHPKASSTLSSTHPSSLLTMDSYPPLSHPHKPTSNRSAATGYHPHPDSSAASHNHTSLAPAYSPPISARHSPWPRAIRPRWTARRVRSHEGLLHRKFG